MFHSSLFSENTFKTHWYCRLWVLSLVKFSFGHEWAKLLDTQMLIHDLLHLLSLLSETASLQVAAIAPWSDITHLPFFSTLHFSSPLPVSQDPVGQHVGGTRCCAPMCCLRASLIPSSIGTAFYLLIVEEAFICNHFCPLHIAKMITTKSHFETFSTYKIIKYKWLSWLSLEGLKWWWGWKEDSLGKKERCPKKQREEEEKQKYGEARHSEDNLTAHSCHLGS